MDSNQDTMLFEGKHLNNFAFTHVYMTTPTPYLFPLSFLSSHFQPFSYYRPGKFTMTPNEWVNSWKGTLLLVGIGCFLTLIGIWRALVYFKTKPRDVLRSDEEE